ncbi:hypothetical protein D4R86_05410 [bacterium]|nr:MAG: hypothetical protein D4R86_05410 [bacterium]
MKTLNENESKVVNKAFKRAIKDEDFAGRCLKMPNPDRLKVDYVIDLENKFTTCLLKEGKNISIGTAKRCTYRGNRSSEDMFDVKVGEDIALSRAVKNYIIGTTIKL